MLSARRGKSFREVRQITRLVYALHVVDIAICDIIILRLLVYPCYLAIFDYSLTGTSVTERYLELLKDSSIKGFLFQQQNYVRKPE